MYLIYEYWPHPIEGTQDDPITDKIYIDRSDNVHTILTDLISQYGSRLILAYVKTIIYRP